MSTTDKLSGRTAIVTGAARGIGAAIADKLASEGARVLAVDLDAQPLEDTTRAINGAGGNAVAHVADVTAPEFGETTVASALDQLGGLDIIVNNAGYIWNTTIQKTSDEQWQAMFDVHATAPFRLLRAALPHFKRLSQEEPADQARPHRKVVNISSISGTEGSATQIAYSAAKAAVVGMTRTLALEWARYRVNVNCVAFGFIDTRLTQAAGPDGAYIDVKGQRLGVGFPSAMHQQIQASIPFGRSGTPEEAAGAVYLLCLPEADFVTGQVLTCSGGP